ncbi:MAG: SUMF1/EgtB/PvdO family nonheme iron enzyme [Chlorobaculum sp.]|nr:SUMF1/EgtB/PvdO family nonheme iron enzyme [Chlorobaculum sp.]
MPDNPHRIKILIASPSDVKDERKAAIEVVRSWNAVNKGVVLEAVDWETYAAPESAGEAQEKINKQIVDRCDCAVGIFWTRIGTPTKVAPGGAVEELQRLDGMGRKTMVYFSNAKVPRTDMDYGQLQQVDEYRKKREKDSFCWSYDTVNDFEKEFLRHLGIQIPRWFPELFSFEDSEKRELSLPVFTDLDRRYRSTLTEELNKIRLLGSPAIQNVQVGLDDTFVPLRISHTWKTDDRFSKKMREEVMQEEMRMHSPDELMRRVFPAYRLLLVIGDPGAGKTTLLKYYALCCLQEKPERLFGDAGRVRAFYLPLRELKLDDNRQFRSLPEQLALWAAARANAIEASVFDEWLRNAGGVKSLVLLDGLDEISDLELRKAACQWIDRQHAGFPEAFFVVTSRLTGYRKTEGVELAADHIRADVMDFTAKQQEEFLSKWFKAAYCRELPSDGMNAEEWKIKQETAAEERTRTIVEYLAKPENRGLRELAAVPMMLQIMAILWKEREFLPGNRVKLYGAALDYLLEYRDDRRKIPPLLPADKARLVLAPAALWMQEELEADEAECSAMHTEMQKALSTLDHPPSAEAFCKNLIDRAGLLVGYGDARKEYLFRHKTFREYLAGSQLTEKIKRNSGMIAPLVAHFGEDWWNEPLTFFMAQADAAMFDKFMEALFDSEVSAEFTQKQQALLQTIIAEAPQKTIEALCRKLLDLDTTANRQRYILDCLKNIGKADLTESVAKFLKEGIALNQEIATKAYGIFDSLFSRYAISPQQINLLANLRLKISSNIIRNPFEFNAQYILIPGGKYIYSRPQPRGTVVTVPDLWFAKYPVTNRQYRSFLDFLREKPSEQETSLTVYEYTQALQCLANSRNEIIKGFNEYQEAETNIDRLFTSYFNNNRKVNKDDQPVVGVNWFGARAYCLWLSMLSGEEYRLPNEQEWEWAAGGRREEVGKVLKVKAYPWGDKPEPTPSHANYNENEGLTTPVGRYPDGATPEGLYDMAGNVWEWIDNRDNKKNNWEALRGGSWNDSPVNLRCLARINVLPDIKSSLHFGFRVVRSVPKS